MRGTDHYVWRLDPAARQAYYEQCWAEGTLPIPTSSIVVSWSTVCCPARGFDLAHSYLDSKVEAVVGDFMDIDLASLGTFDVVLYFGVLYHMVNPIEALKRVRQVTAAFASSRRRASRCRVRTKALSSTSMRQRIQLTTTATGRLLRPSSEGMCRSAGFRQARMSRDRRGSSRKASHLMGVLRRAPVPSDSIAGTRSITANLRTRSSQSSRGAPCIRALLTIRRHPREGRSMVPLKCAKERLTWGVSCHDSNDVRSASTAASLRGSPSSSRSPRSSC